MDLLYEVQQIVPEAKSLAEAIQIRTTQLSAFKDHANSDFDTQYKASERKCSVLTDLIALITLENELLSVTAIQTPAYGVTA